jgi:hypothetical protein
MNRNDRSGKAGQYLSSLNWAWLNGLSLLTWGRQWVRPLPRNARSSITGFDVRVQGCEPSGFYEGPDLGKH